MQTFEPMTAAYDAEKRHTRLSTPWELCHEASKIQRSDLRVAAEARHDRIRFGDLARQEHRAAATSAKAPTSSSFFHSRERVMLPMVELDPGRSFAEVVAERRSVAEFGGGPMSLDQLSFALRSAAGPTHAHPRSGVPLRAAPASGGLYELEFYLAARAVVGLPAGLYHYHANSHSLARLGDARLLGRLAHAAVSPQLVESAAAYILMTSMLGRLEWKYAQRAYRFSLLNAGHAAQQLCLAATAQGLAVCPHGGFVDNEIAECLGVDGITELVVHSVCIGTQVARSPRAETAPGRTLRRLDSLALAPRYATWPALEALVTRAIDPSARGGWVAGRESLLHLRALLPRDRSICDYQRYWDDPSVDLEVDDSAVFAFPRAWGAAKREAWRQGARVAARRVAAWLGAESTPRVFLDLGSISAAPKTENKRRWLHRRVVFPEEFLATDGLNPEVLLHELTHAAYLPHNRVLAEGIAYAVGLAPGAARSLANGFAWEGRDFDPLDWLLGRGATPIPIHVFPAVAASLVEALCERFGRDAFLCWTDTFLYPATAAERRGAVGDFRRRFGVTLRSALRGWRSAWC